MNEPNWSQIDRDRIAALEAENKRLREVIGLVQSALAERLLAKGPLAKSYAHNVMQEINEVLAAIAKAKGEK